jgi:hypothetical protein
LEQQRAYDGKEEIANEGEEGVSQEISVKELEQIFPNLGSVKRQTMDQVRIWKEI